MFQGPRQFADEIRRQYGNLRRYPQSGDTLIIRITDTGVDVKMLDDKELDPLCDERRRP